MSMFEFFDTELPTERDVRYSYGAKTPTAQYINIHSRRDEIDIRTTCKEFLVHVQINKDNNQFQRDMYNRVFVEKDKSLPRPTKEIEHRDVNTIASFIDGLERNFEEGTRNYTTRQWDHVIDIANIGIEYFNVMHPDKSGMPRLKFKPVRWSK